MEEIFQEFGSFLLSALALLIASLKGKNKKVKTEEEIEAEEEAKKQKRVKKALKKNGITPKEEVNSENNKPIEETIENDSKKQLEITIPNLKEN